MEFFGSLVFYMQAQNFGVGEDIIIEKEDGDKIFFIVSGRVAVLHKKTHTYLEDLIKDDYFGEISFFTEKPRLCSVKSRDFTCTITLSRDSYFQAGEDYDESLVSYLRIT
jgi:CRP-like cAMP-binding protein